MSIYVKPKLSPTFNATPWLMGSRSNFTNCYTYALGTLDLSFLDVGGLKTGGINYPQNGFDSSQYSDPEKLKDLLISDGLESVPDDTLDAAQNHLLLVMGAQVVVACFPSFETPLITASEHFFHCMLVHGDYTVSEKGGATTPNNKRNDGRILSIINYKDHYKESVEKYARLRAPQAYIKRLAFAGLFRVPESGLTVCFG